jgi:hypothetical protein
LFLTPFWRKSNMLDYSRVEKTRTETLGYLPNVNLLMKISLGLILFTIVSTALVYAETQSVTVDGTSYDVSYTGTDMTVSGIEADTDFISLILTVDVTGSSGTLDITFDRSFFDSIYNEADDDFIILVDGDEPTFTETQTNSVSRTLSIELPAGSEEVEIIGSSFNNSVVEKTPVEEPVVETPVEEPVVETPVEEPVVETPVEEPVVETPVEETPRTQCGPGTVLKEGACVLDERCGPGTSLEDGVCVLDSTPAPTSSNSKGLGKELIIAVVAGIAIAGTVGVILAIISKASKSSN